jgi:hypothetical protein
MKHYKVKLAFLFELSEDSLFITLVKRFLCDIDKVL